MAVSLAMAEGLSAERTIHIAPVSLHARVSTLGLPFTRQEGHAFGLDYGDLSYLDFLLPFSQGRGIASADFNRDGWVDVALATNQGVMLYKNLGTLRFVRLPIAPLDGKQVNTLLVAFVDINNDGWQDLYLGTFGDYDYIVLNDQHDFQHPTLLSLPHQGALFTQAASFFDIDKDAHLDFVKGNWFFVIPRAAPSARVTNYLVRNHYPAFEQLVLNEIVGDTLAILLTDWNRDQQPDLIVGNDFMEPDIYYLGTSNGTFHQLTAADGVPVSAMATMSIDTADFNNDLLLDIYVAGKMNDMSTPLYVEGDGESDHKDRRRAFQKQQQVYEQTYCLEIANPADRERCNAVLAKGNKIRQRKVAACQTLTDTAEKEACIGTLYLLMAWSKRSAFFCQYIPETLSAQHTFCDAYFSYMRQLKNYPEPR